MPSIEPRSFFYLDPAELFAVDKNFGKEECVSDPASRFCGKEVGLIGAAISS